MRFALSSAILLATVVGVTAAPIPKAKVKDEESIVGTWQVEKFDFGADAAPVPTDFTQMKLAFSAEGKLTITMGDKPQKESAYKLDPAAKIKAIDITGEQGRTASGIYELDGDTLKICVPERSGTVRPTEMKPDGKQVAVVTLKRIKEEKKEK